MAEMTGDPPPAAANRPADEAEFAAQWRNAAYNCFSSGHKFCREVCPAMQVTRTWSMRTDG